MAHPFMIHSFGRKLEAVDSSLPISSSEKTGIFSDISKRKETISNILISLPERYKRIHQGKVRDTYEHPDFPDQLIIIATDRVSTHDVVHTTTIPGKGEALTQISNFWFEYFKTHPKTKHIPTQQVENAIFPDDFPTALQARTIIAQKLSPLPTEAIVRGFHYGSATKGYDAETGKLATGKDVGKGLLKCSPYESALFTPSTKGKVDTNINFDQMVEIIETWIQDNQMENTVGKKLDTREIAATIQKYSITLYETANQYAQTKGITIGDTKFEFALNALGQVVLIDETCTPDSSRFWLTSSITPGKEPISYDKQPLRDEAIHLWEEMRDNTKKTPLTFSQRAILNTQKRYTSMRWLFTQTSSEIQDEVDALKEFNYFLCKNEGFSRDEHIANLWITPIDGMNTRCIYEGSPEWIRLGEKEGMNDLMDTPKNGGKVN